jgi:cellulose synthase/poly-beta-1,6-N-acetylglucosamine synthase-like glycosyltransferase
VLWYWFFVGPALLLAILSLRGERKRAQYAAMRLSAGATATPPATVIVPVKGSDDGLRDNLAALASFDYPDYELIVAAQKAEDIPAGVLPRLCRVVLAHSANDPNTGEKVLNLQAAVRAARRRSEVFAFADSDSRPSPGWLRALVAPLSEKGVGASTGFRWFTPEPPTFWNLLRSVWDAVATGQLGPGDNPFVWGGAMAIRRAVFVEANVAEYWKNTVSDDYALADAVHKAELTIAFAPGALTASFDRVSARELFSWSRRQMTITRRHRPKLWWMALAAHIFYCGGMLAAAIRADRESMAALMVLLGTGMWKGWRRARLARRAIPQLRHAWAHAVLVPPATWLWLIALAGSAFRRTIQWRGRTNDLWKQGGRITPATD